MSLRRGEIPLANGGKPHFSFVKDKTLGMDK